MKTINVKNVKKSNESDDTKVFNADNMTLEKLSCLF